VEPISESAVATASRQAPLAPRPRLLTSVLLRTVPVAALLFLAVGLVADHFIRGATRAEVERRLEHSADVAAAQVDVKLRTLLNTVRTFAENVAVVNALDDVDLRRSTVMPFFGGLTIPAFPNALIYIADDLGRVITANRGMNPSERDVSWLGATLIGAEYLQIDAKGIKVAVPVYVDQRPAGTVVGQFDDASLRQLLALEAVSETVAMKLNGDIVSATDDAYARNYETYRDDGTWLTATATSKLYPPLRLELAVPKATALTPVVVVDRLLAVALACSLVILIAGMACTALFVTRPLADFAHAMQDFKTATDLSRKLQAPRFAEFAEAADAFNAMLSRLEATSVSFDRLETENRHRRVAEQAVREKETETKAIIDNVLDGIITISTDGTILTVNAAAREIFGYTTFEMIGQNVRMLMPEPYRGKHDTFLNNYLNGGGAQIIGQGRELQGQRKSGEIFPMDLGVSELTVRGQTQFAGVVRDITDRKRIDLMKNEFISVVSHELRTPLTSLSGSLALVGGGAFGALPVKAEKLISIAHNNAQRLIHLVNHILDIEKIEAGKIELDLDTFDPVVLAQTAVSENESYGSRYGVTFRIDDTVGSARVRADGPRMMQVLANLLSNAAKFSGVGTEVVLVVSRVGDAIRFAVTDQGPGIEREDLHRLFDKFAQLDASDRRSKEGTGLGLSISQGIARLHGSRIEVRSTVGSGSTFYFDLKEDRNGQESPKARTTPVHDDDPLQVAG